MTYLIILCFFFVFNSSFGQSYPPPNIKTFDLSFKKQSNSWDWLGNLKFNKESETDFGFHVLDRFSTNLNIDSKSKKFWKDENNFEGFFYKKLSDFQTGIYSKSWILFDEQSGNTNHVSNHVLGIKSNYSPSSNLIITPYVGYQRAENKSRIDWGWDLGLSGDLYDFQLDNYRGNLSLNLDYDIYQNRQNSINGVQIKFGTRFSSVAVDSLTVYYGYTKKQYLASDNNNLRNAIIEKKNFHNVLNYKLSKNSNLVVQTLLISTNKDDDGRKIPQRNILKFENRLQYFYYLPKLIINLGFDTFQTTEDNTSIKSDSKELQSNIRSNVRYSLSPKDQFNFNFALGKSQYDTPDTSNHYDSDGLHIVSGLEYSRNFSPVLSLNIGAYINFFHQVFIFKENSANNNWNRRFRLNSEVTYKFGQFRNKIKNEILANYTVYDFDEQLSQSQNFIFRKYILEDSLTFPILPRLFTGIIGRLELDDKGSFIKDEFAQKILQSKSVTYFDIFLRFKNIYLLNFDTGVTYYHRKDWKHVPEKNLIRDNNEVTPYIRIIYNIYNKLQFYSSAAYIFRKEMSTKSITYAKGSLSLIQYF